MEFCLCPEFQASHRHCRPVHGFDFEIENMDFRVKDVLCGRCSSSCEVICVYRGSQLIDSWGSRCERGHVSA